MEVLQSLWIGSRLSVMEQLSIRSFLQNGYRFHLFTYQEVENIPEGTVVLHGEEILPPEEIFCYQRGYGKGSYAAFSNMFRYKLLFDRGGWWTDLDSVCLRPLDGEEQHVMGHQRMPDGRREVASGLMKVPQGSPLMAHCLDVCRKADRAKLMWGHLGPALVTAAIAAMDVPVRILDPDAFYPIDYWDLWPLVTDVSLPSDGYAVHLWNSGWRRKRLDPDAVYPPQCLYEQLKRRYATPSPPGARRGLNWRNLLRLWWRTSCLRRRQTVRR